MRRASAVLLAVGALLLGAAGSVAAQQQPVEGEYRVSMSLDDPSASLSVVDQAQIPFTIRDQSTTEVAPSAGVSAATRVFRIEVSLRSAVPGESIRLWSVTASPTTAVRGPGESVNGSIFLTTGGAPAPNYVTLDVNVSMTVRDVTVTTSSQAVARLEPFRRVTVQLRQAPPTVEPARASHYRFWIVNGGTYPDTFNIEYGENEALSISSVQTVSIGPRSRYPVDATVFGPRRVFEYGTTEVIPVTVRSANNEATSYETALVFNVRGMWMPSWTFPFWVILVALAAYGGQRAYEKVKRDRRRYGHPAPKYTEEQKEKLQQLKERDKEKYEAVKERLDERYEEQLEAYKERKRKGKAQQTGAILAALDEKRKEQHKLRKSGIKKVKKLKKKGAAPDEIYQALDDDEREQLGDDLPDMLTAPTAAGAVLAARDDDEEMGTVDKMRAKKAETERKRLRAEAMMLIEHRREEGYDPEEIRDELSEAQKLALGDDLEFALEGEA